ncbi:MAG: hypothetical protein ACXACU_09090 [Candidatus Hodarchaeales archaeon]|jgi:hypothetical protein
MIPTYKKPNPPQKKKLFFFYLIFLTIIILLSIMTNDLTFNHDSIEFIGAWLLISEILLGFTAAGSTSILTSMSTLQATGKPVTEKTIIQQRIKEENQSFRIPWLILLLVNTIFLILSGLILLF